MDSVLIDLQLLKTDALKYTRQKRNIFFCIPFSKNHSSSSFCSIQFICHFPVVFFFEKYSLIVCITQNKMSIAIYSTHTTIRTCKTNSFLCFFLSRSEIPFNFRISGSSNKSISWHKITCNSTFVPQFPASAKIYSK